MPACHPNLAPVHRWSFFVMLAAVALLAAAGCQRTFVERRAPGDLRVVSYNVYFDAIFPGENEPQAEKFARVVRALDPDVLALQEIKAGSAEEVRELMNEIAPLADGASWHTCKGGWQVVVSRYPFVQCQDSTAPSAANPAFPNLREPAIAWVDLPDDRYAADLYVINNHWKCCGDTENDPQRQRQADAVMAHWRDALTAGGAVDVPDETALVILGDFNLVGGSGPLATVLRGDIANEGEFGRDFAPDWDGTRLTDARPLHNVRDADDYTWRNDNPTWDGNVYPPGRLDFIVYTDSVLEPVHAFVLNTTTMESAELRQTGLRAHDVTLDEAGRRFDHLPVVVDFRLR